MVAINVNAFRGEVPRVSPRLLQANQATRATNLKLTSGRIDPLRGLALVHTSLAQSIKTAYRYRHAPTGQSPLEYWMVWPQDVNVVGSLVADDPSSRVYYSSDDFEPRITDFNTAIVGVGPYPAGWYALGVPSPTQKPTLSVTGGTGGTETRAYLYTFVTALGEESGPSPAELLTGFTNGTWNVGNLQTAPPNSGSITGAVANTPTGGFVTVTFNTTFGVAPFDVLNISGVTGMTSLNGRKRPVRVEGNTAVFAFETSEIYTSGGTWTREAPHNIVGMTKRVYRSAGTEADYLFVAEIPVATTTYADTVAGTLLGEVLPTKNTQPPPKNLTNLISLPNGCLVGLADNQVCFSDPYMPYSWPIGNRYAFASKGVALTAAGNSVIVLTDDFPILFVGSDPEAMSPATMETYAPCVSKRGVVNVGGGCMYPSYDGLWLASPGRVEKLTQNLYRQEEWKLLYPETFTAEFHDGKYYAVYRQPGEPLGRTWIMDVAERDSITRVREEADHLLRNEYDGLLYVSKRNLIYVWDSNEGRRYECDWISKTFQLGKPTNFAVAQVHAEFGQIVPPDFTAIEANQALIDLGADAVAGDLNSLEILAVEVNASNLVPAMVETTRKVQFTLYADGDPVYSRAVTSSTPFRLPAGYRSEVFNIGLNASVPTYSATIAESTAELIPASV